MRFSTIALLAALMLLNSCSQRSPGQVTSGTAIGAGTGALVGLIGGPIGVGVGALVGGVIGAGTGATASRDNHGQPPQRGSG